MNITKLGHCCLLIEDNGKRILTDPGMFSTAQNSLTGIDIILITHEHPDHFHGDSVREILKNNPNAVVVTNSRMQELFQEQGIAASITLVEHEQERDMGGIRIAGFGTEHANIYSKVPNVMNTGYLVQNRFFYPGDAFTKPGVPVEILAMPIAGPWMKISESIEWAIAVHPQVCIPVHDAILASPAFGHKWPAQFLPEEGIAFETIEVGDTKTF